MDILNFISWIKGKRIVTTVPPTQTLIPVGLKDGRRDDEYLAGAITYQDLAAQLALTQSCKIIINGNLTHISFLGKTTLSHLIFLTKHEC